MALSRSELRDLIIDGPGTLLVLEGPGIPRFAARGLRQTWAPIEQAGAQSEDVNGELVDLSPPQFRKYKTEISCSGIIEVPAFSGIFPGDQIVCHCIFEWGFMTDSGAAPIRPVVPGSLRVTDDGFTFYRPILDCRVAPGSPSGAVDDEWQAASSWKLELRERKIPIL